MGCFQKHDIKLLLDIIMFGFLGLRKVLLLNNRGGFCADKLRDWLSEGSAKELGEVQSAESMGFIYFQRYCYRTLSWSQWSTKLLSWLMVER